MNSISILEQLIAYPTVSRDSNLDLIEYIARLLEDFGVKSQLIYNEERTKANLYATLGPQDQSGVMLSGHTDVVPVDGQRWSSDPFRMEQRDGRLFGRGSADMKGFIACVLAMVGKINILKLHTPIHLAFSYDEEIGCVGVRRLVDMLEGAPLRPKFCVIGEPTSMQLVRAHKGKTAGIATCTGHACHSSLAPDGMNAIYLANDLITEIRKMQSDIESSGVHDNEYDVAYTTLHVGVISGGRVLNIVPDQCAFEFEIRHLPEDSAELLLEQIRDKAEKIVAVHRDSFPQAAISVEVTASYPALDTPGDSEVIKFISSLVETGSSGKITFGTEGGLFSSQLGVQTVVLGPGSIVQAHKPDEFIEIAQLNQCDLFLRRLQRALTET